MESDQKYVETWGKLILVGRTDAEAETLNTLATSCEELTC